MQSLAVQQRHPKLTAPAWTAVMLAIIALCLGLAAGELTVAGHQKTLALPLAAIAVLALSRAQRRTKLRVLGAAAWALPLLLTRSFLGLTLSEALLFLVAASEAVAALGRRPGVRPATRGTVAILAITLGLAASGLASLFISGDFPTFYMVCLSPLASLLCAFRLIKDETDARRLLSAVVGGVISFVALVWLASLLGHSSPYNSVSAGVASWRLAYGQQIRLGPIGFVVWSTRMATAIALVLPTCLYFLLGETGKPFHRRLAVLALLFLAFALARTAARGATVGAGAGLAVYLLASARVRRPGVIAGSVGVISLVVLFSQQLARLIPLQAVQRFSAMFQGQVPNLTERVDTLHLTLSQIGRYPFGRGAAYLWVRYGIDEAIVFSMILNGLGYVGSSLFAIVLIACSVHMGGRVIGRPIGLNGDYAALGLATLVAGLLAGISSESVFFQPIQSYAFWTILAIGAMSSVRPRPERNP